VPKTERPRHLKRAVTDCQGIIPHLANKPCASPAPAVRCSVDEPLNALEMIVR
jgi:hypothetical protein